MEVEREWLSVLQATGLHGSGIYTKARCEWCAVYWVKWWIYFCSLHYYALSVQFSSVAQLCRLCDPMNRNTPGLPVHHQLPKFTQTHVHWVGDAIQPSHPLSSPSPPALNLSQHLGPFKWVNSSHEMARILEFQLQHQSFQWTPRTDLLWHRLVGSSCSPRDSQESSKHHSLKASILWHSAFFIVQLTFIHDH